MHLFEHTLRIHKDENYDYYYPPLQCVLAIKEANAGKLDSHLWYFSAFCDSLNPSFCGVRTPRVLRPLVKMRLSASALQCARSRVRCTVQMVDVGTVPQPDGFLSLYERMRYNPNIGGCCGEIRVRNPTKNFWTMAQQFEYLVANQLDKGKSEAFIVCTRYAVCHSLLCMPSSILQRWKACWAM